MSTIPAPHGYRRLFCSTCGTPNDVPIHCASKFCDPCGTIRKLKVRARIGAGLRAMKRSRPNFWKHIILTVKNSNDLDACLNHLVKSFRKLRQRRCWRETQILGFYTIEITHSGHDWHPHLHIIAYGLFLPWAELLENWMKITHDSRHIRILPIPEGTLIHYYVTRYITKPSSVPPELQSKLDSVTKHRRLFGAWGMAAALLRDNKPPPLTFTCGNCGGTHWIPEVILEIYRKQSVPDPKPRYRSPPRYKRSKWL